MNVAWRLLEKVNIFGVAYYFLILFKLNFILNSAKINDLFYISVHLNLKYYWVKSLLIAIQTLIVIKNYPTRVKIIIVEYTISNLTEVLKITNDNNILNNSQI